MKTYEELKKERYVRINYDLLEEKNLERYGEESLLVFGLIQQNLSMRGQCIFNLQYIYEKLGISKTNSRKQKQIKDTVINLQVGGVIISEVDLSKINNSELVKVSLNISKDEFAIIYDYELEAILSCGKESIFNLFNLITVIKYRAGEKKYCYWSQKDIAKEIRVKSRKTVAAIVEVLENDIKLIKTHNVGNRRFKDGSIKQSNYMYAMNYEGVDELLKEKGIEYAETLTKDGTTITQNENADKQRSVKGKINHLVSKYDSGIITTDEKGLLMSLEKEYYNMIKNSEDILEQKRDEFRLLDIDNITEDIEDIKPKKKRYGFGRVADELEDKNELHIEEPTEQPKVIAEKVVFINKGKRKSTIEKRVIEPVVADIGDIPRERVISHPF